MSTHGAATTSNQRPYQGYPYMNPVVIDVPSLDPNTQHWQHLPRQQTGNRRNARQQKKNDGNFKHGTEPKSGDGIHDIAEENPVACIDHSESAKEADAVDSDNPTIYVDLPSNSHSTITERNHNGSINIDLQDHTDVQPENQRDKTTPGPSNQETRIDTIYFNPFEDRVITPEESSMEDPDSPLPSRIAPPIPDHGFEKQTTVYGRPEFQLPQMGRLPIRNDGFELSPIPINEFPAPPPPYTEFHNGQEEITELPRTQVITSSSNHGSGERKQVICQHCGTRVQTLMMRQVGAITHVIAISFTLFCLIPCSVLVYIMDWFKYKNHYCPHCTKLIGYEVPVLCQKLVFVAPESARVTSSLTTTL